jgi:hypothetical protein
VTDAAGKHVGLWYAELGMPKEIVMRHAVRSRASSRSSSGTTRESAPSRVATAIAVPVTGQ